MTIRRQILVVEDDPFIQESIKDICTRLDPRAYVECVDRADRAEKLLRHGAIYDLVIADLTLAANTNGLDLWRACHPMYSNLNFLFISSISPAEFKERVGERPLPSFLPKPFSIAECARIVGAMLKLDTLHLSL